MSQDMHEINNEAQKDWLGEEVTDPKAFVSGFLQSPQFFDGPQQKSRWVAHTSGFNKFRQGVLRRIQVQKITPQDQPSDDEIVQTYLTLQDARLLLADYARSTCMLRYDPAFYTPETNDTYNRYKAIVQESHQFLGPDEKVAKDEERRSAHNNLADALVKEDIVPNADLGRTVARVLLISEGLDSFQAYESDELKSYKRK
jgi:hypothetical protein